MKTATGRNSRAIAIRLAPGELVIETLIKACEEAGIENGIIVGGIGSLDGASFFTPVPLPEKKAKYGYGDPIKLPGPIELLNMSGMICQGENGEILPHIHCGFSDQQGNAFGGHLIEGNKVLLTVDIGVAELEGIYMGRRYDSELDVLIFNPESRKEVTL